MQILPKSLLKFYIQFGIKPFKWLTFFNVMVVILSTVLSGVLLPRITKMITELFEKPIPSDMGFIDFVLPTALIIFGIYITLTFLHAMESILINRFTPRRNIKISQTLMDYTNQQSIKFFSDTMPGKINSQIGFIKSGFKLIGVCYIIFAIVAMIINVGLIFTINHYVSLIILIGIIFNIVWTSITLKMITKSSKKVSEVSSKLNGKVIDSISNFSIIKIFSGNKFEKKLLQSDFNDFEKESINNGFMFRISNTPIGIFVDICSFALIILCGYLYFKSEITLSEIIYAWAIAGASFSRVGIILRRIQNLIQSWATAKQAYSELVKPLTIVDKPGAKNIVIKKAGIEIKNISFKYGKKKVIDNLSIKIKPGEKVGLVGLSGAGKTTLVNLLMRLYDVNSGQILFDGQNIKNVTQESLRNNITFIPQEPSLFNRTLLENIAYGDTEYSMDEVRNAAKRARADDFIMAADKKYDTIVGDRGIKLSGGQKQRVVIARAFLRNTPILILDEATSALDSETEKVVQQSFEELSKNRTTIVIAHRLSTLQNMDKIIVLEDGQIKESGNHKVLIKKKNGLYCKLWKLQNNGFIPEEIKGKK